MDEHPPRDRDGAPPVDRPPVDDADHPALLTFDDGPPGLRDWLKERSPLRLTLGGLVLAGVAVWGVLLWSGEGVEPGSDSVAGSPTAPATTSPASRSDAPPAAGSTTRPTVQPPARDRDPASGVGPAEAVAAAREAPVPAGPPARLLKLEGDGQETRATRLLDRVVVRVTDGAGRPVPDVEIAFRTETGDALVTPSRTLTDSLGRASTRWRMGEAVGVQQLVAEVPGTEIPGVTFTATALGDGAAETAGPAGGGAAADPSTADTAGAPDAAPTADAGPDSTLAADSAPAPQPDPVTVVRRPFAVGGTLVCGLVSGRAVCRGANDRGQLGGGGGGDFRGLAVGVSHACALDDAGAARCWGANDGGQLGDGTRTDRPMPVPVRTDLRFSILVAGTGHTCGLASGDRAACWGRNLSGQLGDGTREDHLVPTLLPGGRSYRNLVAGWEHTCGLTFGGEVFCWGSNAQGQLGDGTRIDRLAPGALPVSFGPVTAGSRHTCGISGERLLCWGDNSFGQLGDGSTETRPSPTEVVGLPAPPVSLAAGAVHSCALLEDGSAWCWGQNVHGQLGDGTNRNRTEPSRVAGDLTFTSIYAGGALTCAFTGDGVQYCWGLNQSGQLGDGTRENRASPTRVGG